MLMLGLSLSAFVHVSLSLLVGVQVYVAYNSEIRGSLFMMFLSCEHLFHFILFEFQL